MKSLELIAVSNDAYQHLAVVGQTPPPNADALCSTISTIRPAYRQAGKAVCKELVDLAAEDSDLSDLPGVAFYEATYGALATTAPDETVGEVTRRALLLLTESAVGSAAIPPEDDHAARRRELIAEDYLLCQEVVGRNPDAERAFYDKYHRLVWSLAHKATRLLDGSNVLAVDDLFQVGMMHIVKEAGKYSPVYNIRFSSYILTSLHHRIHRELRTAHTVTLPVHVQDMITRLDQLNRSRVQDHRPILSEAEIARAFDLPPGPATRGGALTVGNLMLALLLTEYMGSTDTDHNPHQDKSPGNGYTLDARNPLVKVDGGGAPEPPVESLVMRVFRTEQIAAVLQTLSEREAGAIRLRFGLDGDKPKTNKQVAAIYGLTEPKAKALLARAISKLRAGERADALRPYYEES